MIAAEKIREAVVETGKQMVREGLVAGTWGNISCFDAQAEGERRVAITPSGRDYLKIRAKDVVLVDDQGNILDGKLRPSSELNLHLAIYQNRKDIRAIVHTHSSYASSFAVAGLPIPAVIEDLAQIVGGSVQVAQYAYPGSTQLAENALHALGERFGVLLANHGVVGVGANLREAMTVCRLIEKAAQIAVFAKMLGNINLIAEDDIQKMHQFYLESYRQR